MSWIWLDQEAILALNLELMSILFEKRELNIDVKQGIFNKKQNINIVEKQQQNKQNVNTCTIQYLYNKLISGK